MSRRLKVALVHSDMRFFWAGGAKMRVDRLCEALDELVDLRRIRVRPSPADERAADAERADALAGHVIGSSAFGLYYGAEASRALAAELRPLEIDLLVASDLNVARYAMDMQDALGIPYILDLHNIESRLRRDIRDASDRSSRAQPFVAESVDAVANLEDVAVRRARQVWCCSTADVETLKGMFSDVEVDVQYVPNVVRVESDLELTGNAEVPRRVVFVGSLDYLPNRQAALEVIEEIAPLARTRRDVFTFEIWGKGPDRDLIERAAAHEVRLWADYRLGLVPGKGAISLAPMRVAGGSRLKVLECFSAGSALISTALGVSGTEAVAGEHYARAETTAEFVDRLLEFEAAPERFRVIRRAAYDLVVREYSQEALNAKLREIVESGRL